MGRFKLSQHQVVTNFAVKEIRRFYFFITQRLKGLAGFPTSQRHPITMEFKMHPAQQPLFLIPLYQLNLQPYFSPIFILQN